MQDKSLPDRFFITLWTVMLPLVFLYALSASSLTIGRAILCYSEPFFFLAIRMIVLGIGLILYFFACNRSRPQLVLKDAFYFFAMMVIHIFLAFGLELVALQTLPSYQVAMFYNLGPFMTAILSYIYFSEKMTRQKIVGLCIGFFAFVPQFYCAFDTTMQWAQLGHCWSQITMIGSILATAYGWIVMRMLLRRGYAALFINGIAMLGGGVLALLTSLCYERWNPLPVTSWYHFAYLAILIGLLNDFLFYNWYGHLLKKYTATLLSFAGVLLPFIATLFGMFFLGEEITLDSIISFFIASLGLFLFYQEELKQGYVIRSSRESL